MIYTTTTHKNIFKLVALGLALAAAAPAWADGWPTFNQAALARSFALPGLGQGAVLARGASVSRTALDLTSEFHEVPSGAEQILLDGETQRWSFSYRRGWGDGFEWGIELPLLHGGGGFLDGFIQDWHRWFGLPNGGRENAPDGQYRYRYTRNGATVFDVQDAGTALGDLRLSGGWQAGERLALRALLQLPTGDADRLAGGNAGGALWGDYALAADAAGWQGFVAAGLSYSGKGELAPAQQEQLIPFGGIGLSYPLFTRLRLGTQVYAHAPLYDDSELAALTRAGVQWVFGGTLQLTEAASFDLVFQEDIATHSSPDFSIHLGLTLR